MVDETVPYQESNVVKHALAFRPADPETSNF
jgi:hypothetical protein